jgi:hypothetical protein
MIKLKKNVVVGNKPERTESNDKQAKAKADLSPKSRFQNALLAFRKGVFSFYNF